MPLLTACCILLAVTSPVAAGPPASVQRAFEQGNRRYAAGDYETALHRYEAVLESNWTSGALYYNLANTHYRLGHAGQAVRYYEKARRYLPGNERLQHNLSVVRSRLEAPPPLPPSFRTTVQERLTAFMPPVAYLAVGLVLFLLALARWVQTSTKPATPFRPRRTVLALLMAGLLLAGIGLVLSAPSGEGRAVALRGPLILRSAPRTAADSTATLPEGTVLRLLERRDGWARVRSSRGDEGWSATEPLGEI